VRILVTGAAGFIGSHLCERLLKEEGSEVIGLDAFRGLYAVSGGHLQALNGHPRFRFIPGDLMSVGWDDVLKGVDVVYHLAGIPGVRASWGSDFDKYVDNNILATQRLLEGCIRSSIRRLIYASTSSVYGEKQGPVREDEIPEPLSPYGVSKLTGEHLCRVYAANHGLPVVILRFFTVYGPRQRPDMAFNRFIRYLADRQPIPIYGDGSQTRDFTYVEDGVEAIAAVSAAKNVVGETINIGGKERASVLECVKLLEELLQAKARLQFIGKPQGEPRNTWADISKAQRLLGYAPATTLREGLAKQIADLRSNGTIR
jgi:UDP-glucuronate 4-epimerase